MSEDRTVAAFSQARHYTYLGLGFCLKLYLLVRNEKIILKDWAWATWDGTLDYRQGFYTTLVALPNTCNASWELFCSANYS